MFIVANISQYFPIFALYFSNVIPMEDYRIGLVFVTNIYPILHIEEVGWSKFDIMILLIFIYPCKTLAHSIWKSYEVYSCYEVYSSSFGQKSLLKTTLESLTEDCRSNDRTSREQAFLSDFWRRLMRKQMILGMDLPNFPLENCPQSSVNQKWPKYQALAWDLNFLKG